jgi:hypothetical protein
LFSEKSAERWGIPAAEFCLKINETGHNSKPESSIGPASIF